jgi:hypothetical protein
MSSSLAEQLHPYQYVVQRNWENLPESYEVDGHGDLDLFCSDEDRAAVELICRSHPIPIDVRSPMDNYYPRALGTALLVNRRMYGGYWIPAPIPAFLAIWYHNEFHKEGNPYGKRLRELFKDIATPVRPDDPGVHYNGDR